MQTELLFAAFFVLKVAGDKLRVPHALLEPVEDFPPQERDDHLGELLSCDAFA